MRKKERERERERERDAKGRRVPREERDRKRGEP